MKRPLPHRALAALAGFALLGASCGRNDSADKESSSGKSSGDRAGAFIDPTADCSDYQPTKGIEGDTIKVGTVRPAQGPYAIYDTVTKGVEAYFKFVNSQGGVKAGDGKTYKIELLKEDDQYDPGKTPGLVEKLVENEGVFAMVGSVGTETNLAVRDYLNDACVPSVALATGSPQWGDANGYPWYISGLPSYAAETRRFMEYLDKTKPDATLAVLYQNDDFGKSYLGAIEKYIKDEGSKIEIVDAKPYDQASGQTTEGVTTQLAQSKADAFFVGVGGTPCPATLGFMPAEWKPETYVSLVCTGQLALTLAGGKDEGIYSTQFLFDPANAEDQKTPEITEFTKALTDQGVAEGEITGGIISAGWGFGAIFVKGLEKTPKVTRADLMNTLYKLDGENIGLTRDEVQATTDDDADPWLFEQLRVVRRVKGAWVEVDPFVDYDGKSNDLAG